VNTLGKDGPNDVITADMTGLPWVTSAVWDVRRGLMTGRN
jgi:hypothetical protein